MAKKRLSSSELEDIEQDFNPVLAADKMPIDISGGKRPLMDFMEIPIDQIDPYADKRGSDFTDYSEALSEAMVDSIKEYGLLEPVSIRIKSDGRYELLAGERRWIHAKKAGLKTIPAHVIQADEKVARAIFSLTNILRRPIVYRDLIYGWWQFYISLKEDGKLGEMRTSGSDISPESKAQLGLDGKSISYRQMMRYVRMHNLTDDWITALDENKVTLRVAEVIAGLNKEQQSEVFPFIAILDDDKARALISLSKGNIPDKSWSSETVKEILSGVTPKKKKVETDAERSFKKVKRGILKSVQTYLKPNDYDRAEEVIKKALDLYYNQR